MKTTYLALAATAALVAGATTTALAGEQEFDFAAASFSDPTNVDNDFWPISVIGTAVYASESDDGCEVNRIVVDGVRAGFAAPYDGLTAIVMHDEEWVDEECSGEYRLAERTQDWFAQDDEDNVWYLGEDTTSWDDEELCLSNEGAWEAGQDGAIAGVVMPGNPVVGAVYQQEYYEGEAEDRARTLQLDAPVSIEFGEYAGCLKSKEDTPLAPGSVEHKYYCRLSEGGLGLMLINELKGKTRRVEYIGTGLPEDGDFATDFPGAAVCE